MSFPAYLNDLQAAVAAHVATGEAQLVQFQADARSLTIGYVSGLLMYGDGSELHFREFIDTRQEQPRLMYAYHYQDAEKALIFRYDNAAHRPVLAQPEHKHTPDGITLHHAPALQDVLDEIGLLQRLQ